MSVKENLKYHTNFQVIESNVPPKNNRSGYKGVWWDAHRQMWVGVLSGGVWDKMYEQSRRVYATDGLSPTLHTCGGVIRK